MRSPDYGSSKALRGRAILTLGVAILAASCSKSGEHQNPVRPYNGPPLLWVGTECAPESSRMTIWVECRGNGSPLDSLVLDASALGKGNDARIDTATSGPYTHEIRWTTGAVGVYSVAVTAYSSGGKSHQVAPQYVVAGDTIPPDEVIRVGPEFCYLGCTPLVIPDTLTIHAGQRVAFQGNNLENHRVVGDGSLDTGLIPAHESSGSFALTQPDTLRFHCSLHASERGEIRVLP